MIRSLLIFMFVLAVALTAQDAGIDTDLACGTCHQSSDWKADAGSNFDHIQTGFTLEGTHQDLSCATCHAGSTPAEKHNFSQVPQDCSGCHEDVHNDEWGQDCGRCHDPSGWALNTEAQNHDLTRFPLRGPHRSLGCEQCHVNNPGTSTSLPTMCYGCHSNDFSGAQTPDHERLDLPQECEECHSVEAARWTDSYFDHNNTGYTLIGMHAVTDCASCHTSSAASTPRQCSACHQNDYNSSTDPEHTAMGYPLFCTRCHTPFNWQSSWTHDRTGFVLSGVHADTPCQACHLGGQFDDISSACVACHLSDWEEAPSFSHSDAQFSQSCQFCHSDLGWTPVNWDHDTDTDFDLLGAHASVSCLDCHTSAPYATQSTICYDCHQADYENSRDPDHVEANLPLSCEVCHTSVNWDSEEINHDLTEFPLVGAHGNVACITCHESGYDLPIQCEGCHINDYESTSLPPGPNHEQFEFDMDCLQCHNQSKWVPAAFDHSPTITGFELLGAHQELIPSNCESCHTDFQWTGIPKACEGCHRPQYNATTEPDHGSEGYPIVYCSSCHNETAWAPSQFDHDLNPEQCQTCHTNQYNATQDPPHAVLDFEMTCEDCHSTAAWQPSNFDHNLENTGFVLDGNHTTLLCSSCHEEWQPATEVRTCASASCHAQDYADTQEPPHDVLDFALTCEDCHTTSAWSPSSFEHDVENTGFLIDGAHTNVVCSSCHQSWEPATDIRTCAASSCHLEDFSTSLNPPHETMGFTQNCLDCHSTNSWQPSAFEHSTANTGFALNGAHASVICINCHSPWQLEPQPRTCSDSDCHLSDYNGATNPNHAAASFPLDCEGCHTETAWEPATFDHDAQFFPIYSGQHLNEWSDCTQCHINNNDWGDFTCFGTGCHSVTGMNQEHCEGGTDCESCNGHTYPTFGVTPEDCLTCHPNGDEDDCGGDLRDLLPFRPKFQPTVKPENATD